MAELTHVALFEARALGLLLSPTPRGSSTHTPWGFLQVKVSDLVQTYGLQLPASNADANS